MIKVMIERHVALDLADHYQIAAKKVLQTAMQSPGFISGESLKDANDPNHRIVLASYQDFANWSHWYNSPERKASMEELRPMLEDDEKITVFEHI
ncbi:MAG: antibiotic biosynthesis monooxygenase [Motiliproteus sp.]|nr:antibiotic biosynthesis monooxygenase [Motiliproteus sp.]MCW9051087.1 antibiotic biosynthesis monooxygenase [Motiliproteus sp.]